MKYPPAEKLEIIRVVEDSHLPARHIVAKIVISRMTFYRWCDRYEREGEPGLVDRRSGPVRVWSRIPDEVHQHVIEIALNRPALSPREIATSFVDEKGYFVSESSVYRLLKAHDLITSPTFTVIKAADEYQTKTTVPSQMWQTIFTYFKVFGWGWCICRRSLMIVLVTLSNGVCAQP